MVTDIWRSIIIPTEWREPIEISQSDVLFPNMAVVI